MSTLALKPITHGPSLNMVNVSLTDAKATSNPRLDTDSGRFNREATICMWYKGGRGGGRARVTQDSFLHGSQASAPGLPSSHTIPILPLLLLQAGQAGQAGQNTQTCTTISRWAPGS
jgi:hypothetical protein